MKRESVSAKRNLIIAGLAMMLVIGVGAAIAPHFSSSNHPVRAVPTKDNQDVGAVAAELREVLAAYRKIIVLFAHEDALSKAERDAANQVGQSLFHENQARIAKLEESLRRMAAPGNSARFESLSILLSYIESDPGLFDADRLAFVELLRALQAEIATDTSLPAIKMHQRITEDLDALNEIERAYEKEIKQIFGRFGDRSIKLQRQRWEDYVAHLQKIYSREHILKEAGIVISSPAPQPALSEGGADKEEESEIFGNKLPPKTLVLTFDDGPHRRYTEEIMAILKQYNVPGIFFNVGRNLGSVASDGKVNLAKGAQISRQLGSEGYVLGNHSYSHAQLSKETGEALKKEIASTDELLKTIDGQRPPLFRFPYGARSKEAMQLLASMSLKSVMWNIDSRDWADPVPSSIADRVLRTVDQEGRGIILFHDIHERTVKALPTILDRLMSEGYQFATWGNGGFTVAKNDSSPAEKTAIATGYGDSWAVVIGIDEYEKWPKLQYAVRDAQAIKEILVKKFGFAPERVFTVKNSAATRAGILTIFQDQLSAARVDRNDRIFVFFAGHGATRTLSSGRTLGYIVPVDSDPSFYATDAIPMTEIQNIAESLTARHVLFVMDACYSGMGLVRGGAGNAFLRENAKRIGRQMLTAGGADQLVADGGPNGHSVFTWVLLQGLEGKSDLNNDGLITATELAAYIAPAVSSVSQQTPAFGSLPGSEGGDFAFELSGESEFLDSTTAQLSSDAIAMNARLGTPLSQAGVGEGGQVTAIASPSGVTIKDLQGHERKVVPPKPVPISARQLAQLANDRGLQLYKEKQYGAAESQYIEALKLRPDFALAANNLGFVYYKQEKYREAARWFENAIKIDPSRAIAYRNLGDTYVHTGEKDRAKKAYETYLALAPNSTGTANVRQQLQAM